MHILPVMKDILNDKNLIIVSNRLPVTVSKENGELVYTSSSGGLAVAMSSLGISNEKMTWVGWPGIASDELSKSERLQITTKLSAMGCLPVFLSSAQIDKFYSGYANDTIWPLFHYFQSYTQHNADYWLSYKNVNELFRDEIEKLSDQNSLIWIHDYHLMLLPKMLRTIMPNSTIGFFLHIPFPSYEVFRQLPNGDQLLNGLLGADLVGFHIYDYVRHFLSSVMRSVGHDSKYGVLHLSGRMVKADAFPIGIDYDRFASAKKNKVTKKYQKELSKHYKDQKIILSVDRLDYSKGIIKRLEAFEQLLESNKKYHKKITMIVLAVPSRSDVDTYKELRKTIELAVSRINGLYSTVNWTPINYQYRNTPFNELVALYKLADVALVTPLRDGMNLVAKEYVAANSSDTGVLVLSEMAGAIDELHEAIKVNPNDVDSIGQAIIAALSMPKKEQKKRLKIMNARISEYTVQKWGNDFIEQLVEVKALQIHKGKSLIDDNITNDFREDFKRSKKRLLLLDYDGTLVRLQSDYESAKVKPSKQLSGLLTKLTNRKGTDVFVISGRPHKILNKWLGKIGTINLVAEHGAWVKILGKWTKSPISIDSHKKIIIPILEKITARTPGADIEVKTMSVVWHYRKVPTELAYIRKMSLLRELNETIDHSKLSIHQGSKIIEVKPREINKGKIIKKIIDENDYDFIMCIGDDYTDEDMFSVLPQHANTVRVGHEPTTAKYWVKDVDGVLKLLNRLIIPKKPNVIDAIKPTVKKGIKKAAKTGKKLIK